MRFVLALLATLLATQAAVARESWRAARIFALGAPPPSGVTVETTRRSIRVVLPLQRGRIEHQFDKISGPFNGGVTLRPIETRVESPNGTVVTYSPFGAKQVVTRATLADGVYRLKFDMILGKGMRLPFGEATYDPKTGRTAATGRVRGARTATLTAGLKPGIELTRLIDELL